MEKFSFFYLYRTPPAPTCLVSYYRQSEAITAWREQLFVFGHRLCDCVCLGLLLYAWASGRRGGINHV